MWSLLSKQTQATVVVGLALITVWALEGVWRFASGTSPAPIHFVSIVVFLIATAAATFASACWRLIWRLFPIIGRKFFPDLTGTWQGHLLSTWIDPATGKQKPPIPITIWIRQGIFQTSIKLRSGESTSYSKRCLLEAFPEAGRFRVWYSYDNDPKAEFRHRSARHEGVAWLEVDVDTDARRLNGCYYTDRKTSGDIDVKRTSRGVAATDL